MDWHSFLLTYADLSPRAELLFRLGYASLLLIQLGYTWPNASRYFVSQRFGGYITSSPLRDRLHTPLNAFVIMALWTLCALGLLSGKFILAAALLNAILCRYFFVALRWRSILRGMGAPGHMNYWFATVLFLLIFTERIDPSGTLHALVALTARIDFAFIMLAAGIYKIAAGYARGNGFEVGLVNPWWGHFYRQARRLPPDNRLFCVLDTLAYVMEITCSMLFFVPATAAFAGAALGLSFLIIGRLIRLTCLAEMVAVTSLFYVNTGSFFDKILARVISTPVPPPTIPVPAILDGIIASAFLIYLFALPLAYLGMAYNFYAKATLPPLAQRVLDFWTRTFGLILWRVFTEDVINFYVEVFTLLDDGEHPLVVPGSYRTQGLRFVHVAEFITLASIFTTLKYYPHDRDLFQARLLAYAKSLASPMPVIHFRYVSILKSDHAFRFVPVALFSVDVRSGELIETRLSLESDPRRPAPGSPLIPGIAPGSYRPAGSR
jgi:hypothetical protein